MEEVLLAGVGVILLLVEAFVLPGFGIAGILGLLALIAGLMLSTVGDGFTTAALITAAARLGGSLALALVLSLLMLRYLPKTKIGRQLILETGLAADQGFTSEPLSDHGYEGKVGTAASDLRPAGIAVIEGRRVDVVSNGGYIDAGQPIKVDHVDGNRIVVTEISEGEVRAGDKQ